ncbi:MAG TPA: HAD family hydrolase [Candidatus Limnocylindria bacterium]|nr:HAD family hydrolase [Candidatus Limnocylindria bacterium]
MTRPVFLDVDNTLLDNDAAKAALESRIAAAIPPEAARRFWDLYEIVRAAEDYVDLPETVARLGADRPSDAVAVARIIDTLPYRDFLYPEALDMIERLWGQWTPVILSDGDPVFQPRKIERAGLAAAVRGNVLIYVHKEQRLAEALGRFSGGRPVFVDDKARILGRIERQLPGAFTVHVLQGRYAGERVEPGDPGPDLQIARIADLPDAIAAVER